MTQDPESFTSKEWIAVTGGSDFSGILVNKGLYPFEVFVNSKLGGAPSASKQGYVMNKGKELPLNIPPTEQLYRRAFGSDFPATMQLI
jgi:hypothetical protein